VFFRPNFVATDPAIKARRVPNLDHRQIPPSPDNVDQDLIAHVPIIGLRSSLAELLNGSLRQILRFQYVVFTSGLRRVAALARFHLSPRRKLVVEADLEFETHVGAALHRICFVEACATYEQVHECWEDYCKWGTPETAGRGTAGAKFLVVNLRVASLSKCLLFRRTIYYYEKRETSSTDVGGHYCPFSRMTSTVVRHRFKLVRRRPAIALSRSIFAVWACCLRERAAPQSHTESPGIHFQKFSSSE